MFTLMRLVRVSLFMFVLAGTTVAQENRAPVEAPREPMLATAPLVTAAATAERVRFVSPGTVVQLRLEVYNETGQKLFDTELQGGNVLDWHLQNGLGERLAAGSYACVLTLKSLSGRMTQRVGVVNVNDQEAAIETAGTAQLTTAQQQTIGPVESNASLTILQQRETEAITTVTHDSAKGQLTSTTGPLTFGTGDVFSGTDKEHMRITEDGSVGIGTTKPTTRLDVAGAIRARDGFTFSDGSTLKVNDKGVLTRTGADGAAPDAASSTQNKIAKFTDNAGTLGDSSLTDTGGNVGLGVASPGDLLDIAGAPNGSGRSGIHVRTTISTGNATLYFDNDRGGFAAYGGILTGGSGNSFNFFGVSRADKTFLIADGASSLGLGIGTLVSQPVIFGTANAERMRIDSAGNVGIGTTAPGAKLDVSGNINSSTQYNIGGNRVLGIPGTSNTFAGISAGNANASGSQNSFFGNSAGASNNSGASNSFFGSNAGSGNTSGGGNSFFGTDAGVFTSTGNFNAFFGNQAGKNNTASNNSFFGQNAGFGNTTGTFNSFFGLAAGFANSEGFYNSFFGYRAGATNTGPAASANSYFGNEAGENNSSGANNSFFGASAGQFNSTGGGNSFFGSTAGYFNTDGINNSFFGIGAGFNNATSGNSFFGFNAGRANTSGVNNAFFGGFSGQANNGSGNSFFGRSAGALNTSGFENAFFGSSAGQSNTEACCNAFFGGNAGFANTMGTNNSFFGDGAGSDNVSGSDNSFFGRNAGTKSVVNNNAFFGSLAGAVNAMGANNAFFGRKAGTANTSGSNNTFIGESAASANSNGSSNIVIGSVAGLNLVSGNNNIYMANSGANESNTIRIGTEGTQTATFIAGINGINVNPSTSVVVNANGQLGVVLSSRRYKQDIRNMGDASSKLMLLRPVTFLYRPEYVAGDQTVQYGLIAEEVAKVYPDLVASGADGKPQTVRYNLLSTMLLNELQKQQLNLQTQARQLQSQAQQIASLSARLRRLEPRRHVRRRRL
jgi:hypothetical protein